MPLELKSVRQNTTASNITLVVPSVGMVLNEALLYVTLIYFTYVSIVDIVIPQLEIECGTENALHSIVELEKCEYKITGTTPALCLPLDNGGKSKEEL